MCELTGGFYYAATEAVPRPEALRQLADAWAAYTSSPGTVRFADWGQAVDALLALAPDRPVPVVLDEFPYLAREARELPSVLQKALSPGRPQRTASRARLLLCGSSISFMGGLFSGTGFASELAEAAATSAGRIQLIGLDRLYRGSLGKRKNPDRHGAGFAGTCPGSGRRVPPRPVHPRPTESPQLRVRGDVPHKEPTDETALPGTRRHGC